MVDSITLSLPDDIATSVRDIAHRTNQTVEEVVLSYLKNLAIALPPLPVDVQDELSALTHLSDDTLWTIARDQMPSDAQDRAQMLMAKNNQERLSAHEQAELDQFVDRADRLMLRKAEALHILKQRGHSVTQANLRS